MPTANNKTIGTGGDYTTIALFTAAIPANLVTADATWTGLCLNQEFAVATTTGAIFDTTGHTTDATRFITLTANTGASFQDNANVRTNALKYNSSNGACIRKTDNYGYILRPGSSYTVVSKLQFKADGTTTDGSYSGADGSNFKYKDCIFQLLTGIFFIYDAATAINVVVHKSSNTQKGFSVGLASKAIGCTVVMASDVSPSGSPVAFASQYSNNILQSCSAFNFTTPASATGWDTTNSKNNSTNNASGFPGSTGNVYNVSFSETTHFTNAKTSTLNLIPIAGTTLINAGFRDATNAPNDITGTARTATPTIGAWEVTASVATGFYHRSQICWIGDEAN